MSRRGLLRFGILAGMLGIVGCGEESTGTKVEAPPTQPGGARSRLAKIKEKTEEAVSKKK